MERVHRISIIPRGQALGYTLNLPEEDRYLKTKDELLDYMVVLLGGRVTEHLVFGQVTTGASDDLRKVHEISRSMVTQYGMGTELQSKQLPSDDYSMSDTHAQERGRRAAVPHRPRPPARPQAGGREPAAARGLRLHAARRTRCSSATTSTGSWPPTGSTSGQDVEQLVRAAENPGRPTIAATEGTDHPGGVSPSM